jgi:hypothetical protein
MPQSPMKYPSMITVENIDGIIPSVKFLRENFFSTLHHLQYRWCLVFLFLTELAMEKDITDDRYSDGRIPSVKFLPME